MRAVTSDGTISNGSARPDEVPATLAAKSGRNQLAASRRAQGLQDVRALARGGHCQGHVSRPSQRLDLPGEQLLEAEVVAYGGERADVGAERDGRNRLAVGLEADRQLRRQALRVTGAAAVAEEQYLPAALQTVQALPTRSANWLGKREPRALDDGGVLGELGLVVALQVHGNSPQPCTRRAAGCQPDLWRAIGPAHTARWRCRDC